MKARRFLAALTFVGVLWVPPAIALGQDSINFLNEPDLEAVVPPAVRDREHPWSFYGGGRYTITNGDKIADTLTGGGTADFTYDDSHDNGYGWWFEFSYNYNENPLEVNWGTFFQVSGDYFSGRTSTDRGIRLSSSELELYTLLVGLYVQSEDRDSDGDFFWDVRGGIGGAYIGGVDATVTTTAGAFIARGDLIDSTVTGSFTLAGRIGYAETRWAIFAGIGWHYVWEPNNGNLGANPDDINMFPIEVGFQYKF